MPGTVTFRPIEANLTHNTDLVGKMNPYCAFIVGDSIFKGQICKKGGKHPHWDDAVTVPLGNQSQVIVEIMDKDRFSRDDNIGSFLLNLNELQSSGQSSRWYPLTYKNKPAGEILLETTFTGGQGYGQNSGYGATSGLVSGQSTLNQGFVERNSGVQETVTVIEQPAVIQQEVITQQHVPVQEERHFFTEQQQIVEPRTFLKEVDVVETRAHLENIEVLEPTRVMREVQYTQAVPVTKQIEVNEPQVVVKEVEVIEPRLVTKTIQVIENVPVMKRVEVIESVPRMQEVQTFEAQTFTKQVEVTDYVPVQRQVTVTEPVHLKKAVEFVEPVITTKTITKEIAPAVIVDEKITTTVGPASIIHEREMYSEFSRLNISEEERTIRYGEWQRLRSQGYNDQQLESHFTTQGWGPVSHYQFHNYGSQHGTGLSQQGSQYGTGFTQHGSQHGSNYFGNQYGFTENDRTSRFSEWLRLKKLGHDENKLQRHFDEQNWGPINNYRFNELENYGSYGSTAGTQLGGTSQLYGSNANVHGTHHLSDPLQRKY